MSMNYPITRRTALKRLLQVSGTVAVSAFNGWPLNIIGSVCAKEAKEVASLRVCPCQPPD